MYGHSHVEMIRGSLTVLGELFPVDLSDVFYDPDKLLLGKKFSFFPECLHN